MKLHLPKQLFTALIACFSAVSVTAAEITGTFSEGNTSTTTPPTLTLGANAGGLTVSSSSPYVTTFTLYTDSSNQDVSYKTGNYYRPNINVHTQGSWELTCNLTNSDADATVYINSITLNFFTFNRNNGDQGNALYVDVSLADNAGEKLALKEDQSLAGNGAFTKVEFNPESTSIATLNGGENASSDSFTVKVTRTGEDNKDVGTFVGLKDITLVTSATIRSGADVTWTNGADATWSGESWKTTAGTIGTMADANVGTATFADAAGGSHTVTVDVAATAKSIEVSSGNYTFSGTGALSITNEDVTNDEYSLNIAAGASATFNVVTTLAGTVSNAGTLNMGSFTVEKGDAATFGGTGTTNLSGTITNNGTLNLNGVLNISSLEGLEQSGYYSDGSNGIFYGSFSVVATGAEGVLNLGDSFGLQLNGSALSTSEEAGFYYTYDSSTGSIKINEAGTQTYWINTNASYDASNERMLNAESFIVAAGAEFYLSDTSVLARINSLTDTSKVYFRASDSETNLLRFTGASGDAGLSLTATVDTTTQKVTTGNSASSYAGNIIVLEGTTLELGATRDVAVAGKMYNDDKNRFITVEGGATLDVKGNEAYYHVVLEGGATLTNSGDAVDMGWKALPYVELRGDASINSSSQMVMQKGGSDNSGTFQLALNGHKLTKTGANMLYLQNVSIGSGTLQIDAGMVKADTGVTLVNGAALDVIINDGILHTFASLSLNTLTLGANADEVCVVSNQTLTVTGATSAAGKFWKTGSGILSLEGATTFGGEVNVTGGRLKVTGALTAGAINKTGAGTLELASGSGEKKINGTSSISGGILVITQQDAINYGATTSMSISGATLQLDARQTVDSENSFTLSSGHITGSGGDYNHSDASYTAGLDIHNASTLTINSSGASSIATGIGLRNGNGKVKFNVTADTLTTSGTIAGNGGVLKSGAGEMVLSGNNTYTGGTSIEAGTVTTKNAAALGTGGVTMTGGILNVTDVADADIDLTVRGAIVMNADASAKLATTGTTLSLGTTGSVKKSNADDSQHVTIASDGTNAASMTAKADNAQLVQMQADATFTIQDMTLTNTTITAATVETKVNLQNVEASDVMLKQGAFTLNATPTVGKAPSGESHGTLSYSNGLAIATDENASLTLNLDVVNAVAGDAHGTYDLTITLSGFGANFAMPEKIREMVSFDSTSWLGKALVSQKAAEYSVVTEQTPATAGESGVPTVSYSAVTVDNVGSLVITIAGLNVPEPATSTLSLLALAALAARRRRK